MKINRQPRGSHPNQQELFAKEDYFNSEFLSQPLTIGNTRTLVGEFFEHATVSLTGGILLATISSLDGIKVDICPDVLLPGDKFLEVKSCGRGNKIAFYEERRKKAIQMIGEGGSLGYIIWKHDLDTTQCSNAEELFLALCQRLQKIFIINGGVLNDILLNCELKSSGQAEGNGWGSEKYRWYRNFNTADLLNVCNHTEYCPLIDSLGFTLGMVPIHLSNTMSGVLSNVNT